MTPDEQIIINNFSTIWKYHKGMCLKAIKDYGKLVSSEFLQKIIEFNKSHKIGYQYSDHDFICKVFSMTSDPDKTQIEYVCEIILRYQNFKMSDELCDKKEWKDYEWKNDHIILLLSFQMTPENSHKLEFLVNNLKEKLDLDKICLSLQTTGNHARILNLLYFADDKEFDKEKVYNSLLQKYFTSDINIIQDALYDRNYNGITYMYTCLNVKPLHSHYKILVTHSINGSKSNITSLINLMIDKNLSLTYDDILLATQKHIYINNVERFIKTEDEKLRLAEKCFDCHFFKYHDILKISADMAEMYEAITSEYSALHCVKSLIKKEVLPDKLVLKYACQNKSQKKIIPLLMEYVKPDAEIFDLYCNTCDKSGLLSKMNKIVNKKLCYQKSADDSE